MWSSVYYTHKVGLIVLKQTDGGLSVGGGAEVRHI